MSEKQPAVELKGNRVLLGHCRDCVYFQPAACDCLRYPITAISQAVDPAGFCGEFTPPEAVTWYEPPEETKPEDPILECPVCEVVDVNHGLLGRRPGLYLQNYDATDRSFDCFGCGTRLRIGRGGVVETKDVKP